ncbi:MAG TPA: DUF3536 domain-containing protein [Candidatus Limnocylindrales bacterium]|nr:DUF3536 domain-containing protein [Candidatus Limnocylindrales bacterium]
MTRGRLAVHGHFYQPDRRDPFSGLIPPEANAAPHPNWTSRITAECYGPNAASGNFGRIGWDIGPALATWLRREQPGVHAAIVEQEHGHNGLAQAYHHAILPLASARDRRTEIRWGLRDFELRFGHRPAGLWLPETAVDLLTLRIAAEEGVGYTILAPWQAGTSGIDTRRPYRVVLGVRSIIVAFYDGPLSAAVSFEPEATVDAGAFARERVAPALEPALADGSPPLLVVATDGELYGHHQTFRDLFLEHLTTDVAAGVAGPAPAPSERGRATRAAARREEARQARRPRPAPKPAAAERAAPPWELTTLGDVLADPHRQHLPVMTIQERTSWSCHHGVARWSAECPDAHDGRWKQPLRAAFDRLAASVDRVCEAEARALGVDLWAARDGYADVASEFAPPEAFVERTLAAATQGAPARAARLAADAGAAERLGALLSAQASRLSMFASDGWFWDEPSRVETAQVMRFAAHAARIVDDLAGTDLEAELVADLAALRSPRDRRDGAALYRAALAAVDAARTA